MEEWTDKELYYFFTVEAAMLDNPPIETLEKHLKQYEKQEEYLACAGIKLGIDFARFKKLFNILRELEND
tara:strand:+ start:6901 stop:7110 length:210 start_codon:yes stop_codon:yes gene_type:complete